MTNDPCPRTNEAQTRRVFLLAGLGAANEVGDHSRWGDHKGFLPSLIGIGKFGDGLWDFSYGRHKSPKVRLVINLWLFFEVYVAPALGVFEPP